MASSRPWRTVTILAAAVAALGAALVGSWAVTGPQDSPRENAEARVADYIAGKGTHEFVASDSNFRASFPFGAPLRDTETYTVGPVSVEYVTYGTEAPSGAFSVSSLAMPPGAPFDLNAGVNGAAVAVGGRVETATPTTFQDFPAIEFVITGSESGERYVDKGVVVDAGDRVYLLQTIWVDGPAPGYDAFKASFRIGQAL